MAPAPSSPGPDGKENAPAGMIRIGRIGAAHGIAGAVRVKAFTAQPEALANYCPLSSVDGREFRVRALRPAGSVVIVHFEGVTDRNAAEALNGLDLFVPRSRLPALGDEEYYHADLIGLTAITPDGAEIGTVVGVPNYGAGDLLEIARKGAATVLVPFTRASVPEIDLSARRLTVDPPAGLLDQ
jgi:16S rRNA processing protein RimM